MRAVTITLLLVFLTGTQARHFWQRDEPPHTVFDNLRNAVNLYVETAKAGGHEILTQFDASALGKQLDLKVAETYEAVRAAMAKFHMELSPDFTELKAQFNTDMEAMHQEFSKDMEEFKAKVQPVMEDFVKRLKQEVDAFQARLQPLGEELRQMTQQNLEKAQEKVRPIVNEFRDKTRALMDELRQRIPQSEEMRQKLAEKIAAIRERGLPEVRQYQARIQQHFSNLQAKMTPLLEKLWEDLNPVRQSIQTHAMEMLTKVQKTIEAAQQEQEQQQQES